MSNGEFLGNGQYRVGYVKPDGQPWQPVLCSVVKVRGEEHLVFQGCIILGTVQQMEEITKKIQGNPKLLQDPEAELMGVVIRGAQFRWEDKTVPYEIGSNLPQKERVEKAIKHWEDNTSFQFKQRDPETDKNYVVFVPVENGCASHVGMQGGSQEIWLSQGCSTGNVIHEIGHAIGFWHEQSRADRDQYVEIVWANVDSRYRHNFEQHIHDGIDVGYYDYESIMHYPAKAFTVNGQDTIKPKKQEVQIGQRVKLSEGDKATAEKISQLG